MELHRKAFTERPQAYSNMVRARMVADGSGDPADADPRLRSAREFLKRRGGFGKQKIAPIVAWLVATAFDAADRRNWPLVEGLLAMLLMAIDQANLDGGKWALAYSLTLQPEPPWAALSTPLPANVDQEFSVLIDPTLLTAAIGRLRDMSTLNEVRKKVTGKGKGKDKDKDNPEEKP